MSDEEPLHFALEKVVEHEDGGATYSFDMDEKAAVNLAQIGLEFTLYCAAYQLDLQYVLDNLAYLAEKRDNSENDK